jgi:hypothetical protein
MAYVLKDVVRFTTQILDVLLPKRINIRLKNVEWQNQHDFVYQKFETYHNSQTKENLAHYAIALQSATNFLIAQKDVKPDQQNFIDRHVDKIYQYYCDAPINGKIKAPLKIEDSEEAIQLRKFRDSTELKNLQNYLETVLRNDQRSHKFFFCIDLSVNKVPALSQLLLELNSQASLDEVKITLEKFYLEKDSLFNTLNTGQNITTRVFSWLGMQTTTIDLIDALARSIGMDPDKNEAMNYPK